ncbi:MAG: hypothetical protein ABL999_19935 [Pyrinomonadaceae bacterium]
MHNESRRDFFRRLGAVSTAIIAGGGLVRAFSQTQTRPFEFLVVGDSVIWGQGLDESEKFYSLTAEWLRREAFSRPRDVNLKVNAHSGSTLKFHADEAEKYRKIGREETFEFKPEVNVGFPSIWKQIEVAAEDYSKAGKTGADLIMLTGGITDITVAKLLDPFGDIKKLPPIIEKHLLHDMFDVIEHAAKLHPNALIAVVGYYPIISPKTSRSGMFNGWLESMSFPRFLKPVANNPLTRKVYFNRIGRTATTRSRLWIRESNRCLQTAVDKLNAKHSTPRAVFIESPITEETCLETPKTLLFRIHTNGKVEDKLYESRKTQCREALPKLKKETQINYPVRLCEIAAVGHPNTAGSKAYAAAITAKLRTLRFTIG